MSEPFNVVASLGKIEIKHPSGPPQVMDVAYVEGLRAGIIAELKSLHQDLETKNDWLKDMGSPLPTAPLKEKYLAIYDKWITAGSPDEWLVQKGVLTKIIGLVEPK